MSIHINLNLTISPRVLSEDFVAIKVSGIAVELKHDDKVAVRFSDDVEHKIVSVDCDEVRVGSASDENGGDLLVPLELQFI